MEKTKCKDCEREEFCSMNRKDCGSFMEKRRVDDKQKKEDK